MQACIDDGKVPVDYYPRFREYSIDLSGAASQSIAYCPWCGVKLPESTRHAWFDTLEELGIEAELFAEEGDVPDEFMGDQWWRSRGL